MERKVDMKKGLKEKQMEVEVDKYRTMLELKQSDTGERDRIETELNGLREENRQINRREKDLKDEVIACRELLDSKDEEIDILNEKLNNMRRQRDELTPTHNEMKRQNIRKDHIIIEDTGNSATCSSKDCIIF